MMYRRFVFFATRTLMSARNCSPALLVRQMQLNPSMVVPECMLVRSNAGPAVGPDPVLKTLNVFDLRSI